MNKVFCMGWIKNLDYREVNGVYEAYFKLKTKKIVGMKDKNKVEYLYIPCNVKGKKALNIIDNTNDETKISLWARINLDDDNRLTLAIDEFEFL